MAVRTRRMTEYTFTNFEGVWFAIQRTDESESRMPGWQQETFGTTKHIPGSNLNDTYFTGYGPLTISYSVWLESKSDYAALQALKQTSGTLTLPSNICAFAPNGSDAVEIDYFGVRYTKLSDVALMGISDVLLSLDGSVECITNWQWNREEQE